MTFVRLALAGAVTAFLALPAFAQTSPGKPAAPAIGAAPGQPAPVSPPSKTPSPTLVDINSASPADLDALPGIGKARSEAIIKGRPYKGKDDLLNRHILTPSVYNGIKAKIIAKQG